MESGVEAIAQATLATGRWFGRSDMLRRVERASKLGGWSYEVYDCKRLRHAFDLDKNVRRLAIDDEDLKPLQDWIAGLG